MEKDFVMETGKDFVMEDGISKDGFKRIRVIGCGSIPYTNDHKIILYGNSDEKKRYRFPKGHMKLRGTEKGHLFPETPLETAERETREELFLDDSVEIIFQSHYTKVYGLRESKSNKTRSYKTILLYPALIVQNPFDKEVQKLKNNRFVRVSSFEEAEEYLEHMYKLVFEKFKGWYFSEKLR